MKTTDAVTIMHNHYIKGDPKRLASIARTRLHTDIALMIRDARKKARLSQRELAEMTDTCQSVISRLESIDYEGHTIGMLVKIASALGFALHVNILDKEG